MSINVKGLNRKAAKVIAHLTLPVGAAKSSIVAYFDISELNRIIRTTGKQPS